MPQARQGAGDKAAGSKHAHRGLGTKCYSDIIVVSTRSTAQTLYGLTDYDVNLGFLRLETRSGDIRALKACF